MAILRAKDIKLFSIDEISQQLECSTTLLEGLQEKQSSLAYQSNQLKDDLKEKVASSESQKSRLPRGISLRKKCTRFLRF